MTRVTTALTLTCAITTTFIITACAVRSVPAAPATQAPMQPNGAPARAPIAMTAPMSRTEAHQRLDQLWTALKKPATVSPDDPSILWDRALTPPLPVRWPPTPGMDWVQYAYAYGRDFRLADGVRVAKPWATMTFHADGTATLTQLTPALEDGGVQGVTPVGQDQRDVLHTGEAAQATALSLTALPEPSSQQAREVKAYYAAWLFYNGVIAGLVRANHAPFFAWLEQ